MEHFEKLYQKQKAQANARAEKLAALKPTINNSESIDWHVLKVLENASAVDLFSSAQIR